MIKIGDTITFAGVFVKVRWWQFWRWGQKPPVLKQFVVTTSQKHNER